jgi:hypothetical protein
MTGSFLLDLSRALFLVLDVTKLDLCFIGNLLARSLDRDNADIVIKV